MQINYMQLPLFGYTIECKRKDLDSDEAVFHIKINSYSDDDALDETRKYLEIYFTDCEVVKVDKTYDKPFSGVLR